MHVISVLVKDTFPNYLRNLPIPDTFSGWFHLGPRDWIRLLPLGITMGGLSYLTFQSCLNCPTIGPYLRDKLKGTPFIKDPKINYSVNPECDKVVDTVDIEDLGDKSVFCRCWKSKKFPYCDGSHNEHNKTTGDNVGPLIVKKS